MKKILVVLVCLLLVGCNKTSEKSDIEKFKEEYEALNDTGIVVNVDTQTSLKYLSTEETYNMLTSQTGIIYIGFPSCPWCRNMVPILFEAAKENNMTISYFDSSKLAESNEIISKVMGLLYEYLKENENGEKTLYVPDVYFIKDGKIVGHHLGTLDVQKDPSVALTDEQKIELKKIYQDLISKIK